MSNFSDVQRSRAWVMDDAHDAYLRHHRGQLMAMLPACWVAMYTANYGPTADTGGLMRNHAPTIYAYPSLDALFDGETSGGAKAKLPGAAGKTVTERPE